MVPVTARFGPFQLDSARRLLLRDGAPVALTPKAFDALVLLVERRERVVSKQELLAELWPHTAVEEATLSQHIFMVRRALGDSGSDARYVATIARRGYRFVATVAPTESDGDRAVGHRSGSGRTRRWWNAAAMAGVGAAAAAIVTWNVPRPIVAPRVVRLAFPLPPEQRLHRRDRGAVGLSPDGTMIVYAASRRLYLRRIDDDEARPIAGTNLDAALPFFSPDGRWIGVWSGRDSTFKTVVTEGGAPTTVGRAINPRGASWFDNRIVFAEGAEGIMAIPAAGGTPSLWAAPGRDEILINPQVLPGGEAVLVTAATVIGNRPIRTSVIAYSRATGRRTLIVPNARAARYMRAGVIVYGIGTTLFAAAFDAKRLEISGDPIPIARGVISLADNFDIAADGTLVYTRSGDDANRPERSLALVDPGGGVRTLAAPPGTYLAPRVSPDGRRLAIATDDDDGTIWILEMGSGRPPQRLTFDGHARFPVWSPDGRRIAFESSQEGHGGIFVQAADGARDAERLTTPDPGFEQVPESWSADGASLAFVNVKWGVKDTIWSVAVRGSRRIDRQLAVAGSNQMDPRFSPDGRWIAYASEGEAGESRLHVYVQPFPIAGAKIQVSRDGGDMPAWSHDGTRLFYRLPDTGEVVSVRVRTEPAFSFDEPVRACDRLVSDAGYDVTPDDRLVVAIDRPEPGTQPPAQQINVVLNWFVDMKNGAAAGARRSHWSSVSRLTVPVSVSLPIDR